MTEDIGFPDAPSPVTMLKNHKQIGRVLDLVMVDVYMHYIPTVQSICGLLVWNNANLKHNAQ